MSILTDDSGKPLFALKTEEETIVPIDEEELLIGCERCGNTAFSNLGTCITCAERGD